ncbi:MAG: MATE family efflux transporter, partial [Lachnospiraceae bacterium]|nr:MATE family efflux transporter [Lachnospiraceae bacterium]
MARADTKEIFETLPVPRAVREMALPMIFSQIIILIYNMADTFYLGRTNDPFMVAGVSLILPVFNIS